MLPYSEPPQPSNINDNIQSNNPTNNIPPLSLIESSSEPPQSFSDNNNINNKLSENPTNNIPPSPVQPSEPHTLFIATFLPTHTTSLTGTDGACIGCWLGTSGDCQAVNSVCYEEQQGIPENDNCPAGTTRCQSRTSGITPTLQPTSNELCPQVLENGCSVCGEGKCVGELDAVFQYPGQPDGQPDVLCSHLQSSGYMGLIPLDQCEIIPGLNEMDICACRDAGLVAQTPASVNKPTPAPVNPLTMAPITATLVNPTLVSYLNPMSSLVREDFPTPIPTTAVLVPVTPRNTLSPTDSLKPSPSPSVVPTGPSPSVSPTSSPKPSPSPSVTPTISQTPTPKPTNGTPTTSPVPTTPSAVPTQSPAPSPAPSNTNSLAPSSASMGNTDSFLTSPQKYCVDSQNETFLVEDGITERTCSWLALQPIQRVKYCIPSHYAYQICNETCEKCTNSCHDKSWSTIEGYFLYRGVMYHCIWLKEHSEAQAQLCHEGNSVYDSICPKTCNNCEIQQTYNTILSSSTTTIPSGRQQQETKFPSSSIVVATTNPVDSKLPDITSSPAIYTTHSSLPKQYTLPSFTQPPVEIFPAPRLSKAQGQSSPSIQKNLSTTVSGLSYPTSQLSLTDFLLLLPTPAPSSTTMSSTPSLLPPMKLVPFEDHTSSPISIPTSAAEEESDTFIIDFPTPSPSMKLSSVPTVTNPQ
eukprot:CAMPEP_0194138526 /NCGR_PEP_ID=MMETSP0152-20130528/8292_1 /TAXON_ID=1049557 /ORGANISM="Thalassiothrix antarctica, Strain L6-D1" /LENGTH=693 /DNA_ID=CAMNT_0038835995 /DNA_START=103 /DNA_END=2188 /DNA_ORIENTATION=+